MVDLDDALNAFMPVLEPKSNEPYGFNQTFSDWFVVRSRIRSEVAVASLLERRGVPVMVPLGSSVRKSDKPVALFPGYLFVQMDPEHPLQVLQTPGVQSVITCGRSPVRLEPHEVQTITALAQNSVPAEPRPGLCHGQPVRIINGVFRGLEGVLSDVRNETRVALTVHLLLRSVLLRINSKDIELLESHWAPPPRFERS
jgi:transcription antitermination factor NusG